MSEAIGYILVDQLDDSDGELAVSPSASCRTQLVNMLDENAHDAANLDSVDRESPPTPVELLAAAGQN